MVSSRTRLRGGERRRSSAECCRLIGQWPHVHITLELDRLQKAHEQNSHRILPNSRASRLLSQTP
jgi:hypothetical protein